MKKVIVFLIIVMSLTGCNFSNTPSSTVQRYLDNYINLSDDVIMDIETTVASEELSNDNKNNYKKVITNQYENMKYEIKDESINANEAVVLVKITVVDLYKVEKDSQEYLNEHYDEFVSNDMFDKNIFNTYRISNMLKANDTIDYEINFKLTKKDGEWTMDKVDKDTLEKIHGLYNYDK